MSSITFADHKLGGRLMAACDAIGAGHLRRAAGIFNEVADDLNSEAESTDGLTALETLGEDDWSVPLPEKPKPAPVIQADPANLQSCARGAHSYGDPDPGSGWRTCSTCGYVYIGRSDNTGPYDMEARQ